MQHLVLFVTRVGETHVFQFHIGVRYLGAVLWLGQLRHFKKLFKVFNGELHLTHIFREHLKLGKGSHHGNGQHDGKRRLGGR